MIGDCGSEVDLIPTNGAGGVNKGWVCWELTTLWVARLDGGAELKVTDPEEQQGDVEEEEAED